MSSNNTEFGVGASVDLVVTQSSLRDARSQIEEALGEDVAVGLDGSRSSLRADGGGSVASGAATAEQVSTLNSIDETLVDIQETLEKDALTDEGGGGGGTTILGGLGGAGGAGIGGALGTAGTVGGIVGGGILGTAGLATTLADLQQSPATDPIEGTTNDGAPARAIGGGVDKFLDASGIRSAAEDLDSTLGDIMSADPVIGEAPDWLSQFTNPRWLREQPAWAQDILTEAPMRRQTTPQNYQPNEYRGGYNLGGGDNGRAGSQPDPLRNAGPVPVDIGVGDIQIDEQQVRRSVRTAIQAFDIRSVIQDEVRDFLRGRF